jgi:5-methylcytosine-specific restriction endonuclease McrA
MAKKSEAINYNDKNNPVVRVAIWECHNRQCYYCSQQIELKNMQVDHILYEKLEQYPLKRNKVFEQYELDEDFAIDSLENYVSSCVKCNREKGAAVLPLNVLALKVAKRLAPKIKQKINEIKQNDNIHENISLIKSHISGSHEKAENLYNLLTDEDEDFPEEHYVNDFAGTSVYRYSKKK